MKQRLKLGVACICALLLLTALAVAQNVTTGSSLAVEHSVPFGTISGKLLLLGNYLVFVDEQQPNSSYVVAKGTIETLKVEGPDVTVQAREPVRNRSGEVTRLSFRVAPGTDPAVVSVWYGSGAGATAAGPTAAGAPSAGNATMPAPGTLTYEVRHTHTLGDCRGRLIVAPNLLSFESVSNVSHSRRWEFKAIKETELSNPYELEIKPFTGDTYKLRFDGSGMDPAAYKNLVDRITAARASR